MLTVLAWVVIVVVALAVAAVAWWATSELLYDLRYGSDRVRRRAGVMLCLLAVAVGAAALAWATRHLGWWT